MARYSTRDNHIPTKSRLEQIRKKKPEGWTPPNAQVQVSPDRLGSDVKLHWIRRFITHDVEDKKSFNQRVRSGWVPVQVEEIPELEHLKDPDSGFIVDNGCILCKNDANKVKADAEYWEDQAMGALNRQANAFENENNHNAAIKQVTANKQSRFRGRLPSN